MTTSLNQTYFTRIMPQEYGSAPSDPSDEAVHHVLEEAETGTLDALKKTVKDLSTQHNVDDPQNRCVVLMAAKQILSEQTRTNPQDKNIKAKLIFVGEELDKNLKLLPGAAKEVFSKLYYTGRIKFDKNKELALATKGIEKALTNPTHGKGSSSSLLSLVGKATLLLAGLAGAAGIYKLGQPLAGTGTGQGHPGALTNVTQPTGPLSGPQMGPGPVFTPVSPVEFPPSPSQSWSMANVESRLKDLEEFVAHVPDIFEGYKDYFAGGEKPVTGKEAGKGKVETREKEPEVGPQQPQSPARTRHPFQSYADEGEKVSKGKEASRGKEVAPREKPTEARSQPQRSLNVSSEARQPKETAKKEGETRKEFGPQPQSSTQVAAGAKPFVGPQMTRTAHANVSPEAKPKETKTQKMNLPKTKKPATQAKTEEPSRTDQVKAPAKDFGRRRV